MTDKRPPAELLELQARANLFENDHHFAHDLQRVLNSAGLAWRRMTNRPDSVEYLAYYHGRIAECRAWLDTGRDPDLKRIASLAYSIATERIACTIDDDSKIAWAIRRHEAHLEVLRAEQERREAQ